MNLLLDTHAFIWWNEGNSRISAKLAGLLGDPNHTLWLSMASVWEMQIKVQLGKLALRNDLAVILEEQERTNRVFVLAPNRQDVFYHSRLPMHHRDPFDRMILAQASRGNFHLVTCDAYMELYGVPIFW